MKKLIGSILVALTLALSVFGLVACDLVNFSWGTDSDHVHVLVEHKAKEATCTEEGAYVDYYVCEGGENPCGRYFDDYSAITPVDRTTVVMPKKPHTLGELVPGTAATCTEAGTKDYYTCGNGNPDCHVMLDENGKELTDIAIPALGHDYQETRVEPTCTEAGLLTITCSRCDYEVKEVLPATGHTPEVIPGKAATCTETGLTEGSKCSVCGEILVEQKVIPMIDHDAEWVVTTDATCTEEGLRELTCTVCGEVLQSETSEVLGHAFGEWTITETTHARACSRCDETETGEHTYEDGICSVCGYEQEVEEELGEGTLTLTSESITQINEGSATAYASYNGTHTENIEGGYSVETNQVMPSSGSNAGTLQFQGNNGTLSVKGEFATIVLAIASGTNNFTVTAGETVLTGEVKKTEGSVSYVEYTVTVEGVQLITLKKGSGAGYVQFISFRVEGDEYDFGGDVDHEHVWSAYTHNDGAFTHSRTCSAEGCDIVTETVDCAPEANVCFGCNHTYTTDEILTGLKSLASGKSLPGTYTLTGVISNAPTTGTSGDARFNMDVNGTTIQAYYVKPNDFTVKQGDTVTVQGPLKNYNGTLEFDGGSIVAVVPGEVVEPPVVTPDHAGTAEDPFSVADALALTNSLGSNEYYGEPTLVYVTGYVVATGSFNSSYSNWTGVYIAESAEATTADGIQVYRLTLDGTYLVSQSDLVVGAKITICGYLQNFSGNTPEITYNGNANPVAVAYEKPEETPGGEVEKPATPYYEKVTSANDLGSGKYLIVYEAGATSGYVFNGTDAAGNYTEAKISGNYIVATTELGAYTFTITATDTADTYTIQLGGNYYGRTATGNGISMGSTVYTNTITFADGKLTITSSAGTTLLFYSSGSASRFRYYGSAQQPIQLYKLVEAEEEPVEPEIEYTVEFYLDEDDEVYETMKVTGEDALDTLPADPTRANYKFEGWYYGNEKVTASFAPSEYADGTTTLKVYAKWSFNVEIGATDNSNGYPGLVPAWTSTINKGEKVVLSGTHSSLAASNWQSVFMYLYSGTAPTGLFRGDWCVLGDTYAADEGWNIVNAIGPNWDTYLSTLNGTVTLTFDWNDANTILVKFVFSNGTTSNTMLYMITAAQGKTLANSYNIGLACESSHVSLTSFVQTVAEADASVSAKNPLTIGNADNSNGYPGLVPAWTSTINKGEKVVLSGTHSSLAASNWQSVFMYLYSGTAPTGLFRGDWCVLGDTYAADEGWNIENTIGPNWDTYLSTLNGTVLLTFDWSDANTILVSFVFSNGTDVNTMLYTITAAEGKTLANSYNIGLACESSHVSLTSLARSH